MLDDTVRRSENGNPILLKMLHPPAQRNSDRLQLLKGTQDHNSSIAFSSPLF